MQSHRVERRKEIERRGKRREGRTRGGEGRGAERERADSCVGGAGGNQSNSRLVIYVGFEVGWNLESFLIGEDPCTSLGCRGNCFIVS